MSLNDGVLLGSQTPTVANFPDSVFSHAEDAILLSSSYGIVPDPWSATILHGWLGENADGRWSASRCGCAVPRQNGKNVGTLEVAELYKLVVLGRKILHTAHEVKTARKSFLRMAAFFDNPKRWPELAAMVVDIRRTNGQEQILLSNGGSIEYIARSRKSGRGFTVDDLVCDEAQELTEEEYGALLPTISSAPSGNPQQVLVGTPPETLGMGEAFVRMRADGLNGVDRLAWAEFSVTGEVDIADRALWAATNPALGRRLGVETVEDELAAMSPDMFARERLGRWPTTSTVDVVDPDAWADGKVESSPEGFVSYGLDMSPDRSKIAISVAVRWPDDGRIHVEVAKYELAIGGTDWIVQWLAARWSVAIAVVIDAQSPAMSLVPRLRKAGVKVTVTGTAEYSRACGDYVDGVRDRMLTHFDQPALNLALAGAKKRSIGVAGGWGWDRKTTDVDLPPLVSATLAAYGLLTSKRNPERKGKVTAMGNAQAVPKQHEPVGEGWQFVDLPGGGRFPYRIVSKKSGAKS